jgi:acetyl esterase/lipase
MKRLKKYLRSFLILGLVLSVLSGAWLSYFLISNDAPIITGNVIRNIAYKPGLELDLYRPTKDVYEKAPVVVYIHGGAWMGGLKESLNFNRFNQGISLLREAGYTVVSINYSLAQSGKSAFPACIEDASDAVDWITSQAEVYNLDINNIGLLGESAGAHIAMMLAYAPNARQYTYVVDVYGPNHLAGVLHSPIIDSLGVFLAKLPEKYQSEVSAEKYIFALDPKANAAEIQQMIETFSPYNFITSAVPPTLIIHGDSDRIVPIDQSLNLHHKLDSLIVENELFVIPGADHNFIGASAEQKTAFQKRMVDFIMEHYSRNH